MYVQAEVSNNLLDFSFFFLTGDALKLYYILFNIILIKTNEKLNYFFKKEGKYDVE